MFAYLETKKVDGIGCRSVIWTKENSIFNSFLILEKEMITLGLNILLCEKSSLSLRGSFLPQGNSKISNQDP